MLILTLLCDGLVFTSPLVSEGIKTVFGVLMSIFIIIMIIMSVMFNIVKCIRLRKAKKLDGAAIISPDLSQDIQDFLVQTMLKFGHVDEVLICSEMSSIISKKIASLEGKPSEKLQSTGKIDVVQMGVRTNRDSRVL